MLVKYNKVGIININDVVIKCGANDLDENQTKKFLEFHSNPQVKNMKECGELEYEVLGEDGEADGKLLTPAPEDKSKHLVKLKPKEAIDLVKLTVESGLLQLWKTNEKRKNVEKAIDEQLAALAAPVVRRSDKDEEKENPKDGADGELKPDFSPDEPEDEE